MVGVELEKNLHLDSPETLNRIVRSRIPFIAKRWSKKRLDKGDRWDGINEADRDLKFKDLKN